MTDPGSGDTLLVGRVARAHGNKGQVIVNPETDFPEDRFAVGREVIVELGGRESRRTMTAVRFHQGRPIVALSGVETMNDAEALAGAELKIPAAEIAPLPADTFHHHELVGCEVQATDGRSIGRVTRLEGPMTRSLLAVATPRGEALIPFVRDICVRIDPANRVIVVDLPEGLLEL